MIVVAVDGADRDRRDRDRRLPDARREPAAVAILRWLYRWPLFIPFIVAAQCMRTFLAKNGMLNHVLRRRRPHRAAAADEPARLARHRHRLRLEAGAVRDAAARRRDGVARPRTSRPRAISARRACACCRHRAAAGARTLLVGLVLSFVTMLSVLSVPLMIPDSADDDHRRHGLPDQHVWRLRGRQCAVRDLLADGRARWRGSICGTP